MVNDTDSYDRTALHWVAIKHKPRIMELLISYGAYDLKDNYGIAPNQYLKNPKLAGLEKEATKSSSITDRPGTPPSGRSLVTISPELMREAVDTVKPAIKAFTASTDQSRKASPQPIKGMRGIDL